MAAYSKLFPTKYRYTYRGLALMDHKIAKLLLEQADSFLDRTEAVKTALSLGMPLNEIEAYLDWLDASGLKREKKSDEGDPNSGDSERPMAD